MTLTQATILYNHLGAALKHHRYNRRHKVMGSFASKPPWPCVPPYQMTTRKKQAWRAAWHNAAKTGRG